MARIKFDLPESFTFQTDIDVRITDINYGGHAGNDAILSLIHEARMRYLKQFGYSETSFAGMGLIMSDVGIIFKSEVFYGDLLTVHVVADEFSKVSFEIYYKLEKKDKEGKVQLVASAKTGMVCMDYTSRRIAAIPEEAIKLLKRV